MPRATGAFVTSAVVSFLLMTSGYLIAIIYAWPPLFFAPGRPDNIELESMIEGTALSPPLWAFLTFAVLISFVPRGDRFAGLAGIGLLVIATFFLAGAIWQPFLQPSEFVPREAVLAAAWVGGAVFLLTLLTGLVALRSLLELIRRGSASG